MRLRFGLKSRFMFATLGLAGVLIGGFTLAIQQFIEALEKGLSLPEFRSEFVNFTQSWLADPSHLPPTPVGYRAYLASRGERAQLPPALRALAPGVYEEITVGDGEFAVGRYDHAGASLFMLRDAQFDPVERLENDLLTIAGFALVAALLMATGMALWLVRLVLRPVEALARDAAAIQPGTQRRRLEGADDDPALGVIAQAFDATLARYDDLVEHERAFARDASHELRTPLTVILTGVELLEPALAADSLPAIRLARIRAAAEQMQSLTEGLLFLARPDPAPPGPGCTLASVVTDAVRIQRMASPPSLDLHVSGHGDISIAAPRGLLLCVLTNLLRNAIEHGGGGRIDITLLADGLRIADDGPGIDATLRTTLFDAHSRGPASSGHGLGLHIVRRICAGLGWTIDVTAAGARGTRFDLRFSPPPHALTEP